MNLEMLKIIIMACQLGATGTGNYVSNWSEEYRGRAGSNYNSIMKHQIDTVVNDLKIQRRCQSEIIKCVKDTKFNPVTNCLLNPDLGVQ